MSRRVIITRALLRRLAPPGRSQLFVRDSLLTGFATRVTPAGTKSFVLERRVNGRVRRVTLGRYPQMSVEQARARAGKLAASYELESADSPRRGRAPARGSLADRAYVELKRRIINNLLPPGLRALETELAAMLGMSRTPLRSALRQLTHEGLIELIPRRGMRVLPLFPDDIREIYRLLGYLETAAAEMLARDKPGARRLAPLRAAVEDMQKALKRDDRAAWSNADQRFHRFLVELCGNRRLSQVANTLLDHAHRARMFTLRVRSRPTNSTRSHAAVYRAICRGDAETARRVHLAHKQRWEVELMDLLTRHRLEHL